LIGSGGCPEDELCKRGSELRGWDTGIGQYARGQKELIRKKKNIRDTTAMSMPGKVKLPRDNVRGKTSFGKRGGVQDVRSDPKSKTRKGEKVHRIITMLKSGGGNF